MSTTTPAAHTPELLLFHDGSEAFKVCQKPARKDLTAIRQEAKDACGGEVDVIAISPQRLLACVSACAGLNPEALPGALDALAFYANPENWKEQETGIGMAPSEAEDDYGHRAAKALAALHASA